MSEAAGIDHRLARLRERLDALEVDALLVSAPTNRRWLSGFTGSAGVLVVDTQRARIATDGRYHEQAQLQAPSFELVPAPLRSVASFVAPLLEGLGGRRLGFEAVSAFDTWRREAQLRVLWVDDGMHAGAWDQFAAEQGRGLSLVDWTMALASREMSAPVFTFDADFAAQGIPVEPQ